MSSGSPASRSCTKLTPFTTRPAVTSRQGMTRLAKGISGLAERLVGRGLRGLGVGLAFLQRAPGDGAHEALGDELRADRLHVRDAGKAAGGDDGRLQRLRELEGRVDVDAAHHPVAADVGVDDRFDAVFLELLR